MLVLSRELNEQILLTAAGRWIGTVRIADIRGHQVRVGLILPRGVVADREELAGQYTAREAAQDAARLRALLDLYPPDQSTVGRHMHEVVALLTGGGDAA